jgi:hypothetical protein
MKECEEKEDAGEFKDDGDDRSIEDRRKDRRECLDMLKHELDRIRNGGNPYDFDWRRRRRRTTTTTRKGSPRTRLTGVTTRRASIPNLRRTSEG